VKQIPSGERVNILPGDGEVYLIDDKHGEDWPAIMKEILAKVLFVQETINIFGKRPLPRETFWCGDFGYTYSKIYNPPVPMPSIVRRLMKRAEAITGTSFNGCLLNYYKDGTRHMLWHADDEREFGYPAPYTIASLSLGGTRNFMFRRKNGKNGKGKPIPMKLTEGMWVIMSGETQNHWLHGVPPQAKAEPRVNLTFRLGETLPANRHRVSRPRA